MTLMVKSLLRVGFAFEQQLDVLLPPPPKDIRPAKHTKGHIERLLHGGDVCSSRPPVVDLCVFVVQCPCGSAAHVPLQFSL